jgi:glycine/D-amino acid oxidase-like deaminating enzyme
MVVSKTDIAIVGGGIQGIFLAYYAKIKFPEKTVSLFESRLIGNGITAYSAHLHSPHGTGEKHLLTIQSMHLFKELTQEYKDFPLIESDLIGICKRGNIINILNELTEEKVEVDGSEYPFCELPDEYLRISGLKGYVTKRNLMSYLMELTIKIGVKIHEGTTILNVKRNRQGLCLLKHSGEKITASVVFTSTGKNMIKILKSHWKEVRTKKVISLHIDYPALSSDPIYYFFDDDAFLLPQPYYNRYLFSYCCNEWNVNEKNSLMINGVDLNNGKEILNIYTKDFSTKILGGQVYLDVYNNPSSSPIIAEIEKNHYVVGATGGSGIRLAPALAVNALNSISL